MSTFRNTVLSLTGIMACAGLQADASSSQTPHACSLHDPSFERGDEAITVCRPSYNPPAQVHLNRSLQGFLTASYLYWNAQQEGMDLATQATYTASNQLTRTGLDSKPVFQDLSYNSGFKVGLGYNFESCDNWTLRADYTRLHQRTTTSASAPSSTTGEGVLYVTDWFSHQNLGNPPPSVFADLGSPLIAGSLPAAKSLHSSWGLKLDWLDLSVSRAFYQGKRFIMTPFASLRASWISQSLSISLEDIVNETGVTSAYSHNHLHSWGIGPRIGTEGRFLLGAGFRLQGELGTSLLFTQYDRVSHSESGREVSGVVSYGLHKYTCLRPMLEANLGLGWGTYLSKQRYHIDLSATYDFNYLWGQNMMRTLNDMYIVGSSGSSYDLSLQGLTVSAAFHF